MRSWQVLHSLFSLYEVIQSKRIVDRIRLNRVKCEGLWKAERKRSHYFAASLLIVYCIMVTVQRLYTPAGESSSTSLKEAAIHTSQGSTDACDIFNGRWVYDSEYPLYKASACPFAEAGFRCQNNGRRDKDYMKWRWQPYGCDLPRFNASEILKRLEGARIVFVGDSMGRTQWESLVCLLMQDIRDQNSVYEVNGNKITKRIPYLGVRFRPFNLTVEYYRSPFLVQKGFPPKRVPKRVLSTLKLDKVDPAYKRMKEADLVVFNTGHWWTTTKTFETGCYFQVNDSLKLGMSITSAFEKAVDAWASWVGNTINTNRTRVYFRSFETPHWHGSFSGGVCKVTKRPLKNAGRLAKHPLSQIVQNVIANKNNAITMLNITGLSAYRSDAHLGKWGDTPSVPDCSHWCLPGVPDTWNELLFASFFMKGQGNWLKT